MRPRLSLGDQSFPHRSFCGVESRDGKAMSEDLTNSPCTGICAMGQGGYCLGCFRTLDEITHWISFTETEKKRIIEALPQRVDFLFA